jgi:CheY-like chemotaxis protein
VIVDDHEDTRNLLRFFLERCGAQPTVTKSGQEALEVIKKARPDLFVDLDELVSTILKVVNLPS